MNDNYKGMSITHLATLADAIKELTYKEMKYVTKIINTEILRYDGDDYLMADVLEEVADEILDELRGDDEEANENKSLTKLDSIGYDILKLVIILVAVYVSIMNIN